MQRSVADRKIQALLIIKINTTAVIAVVYFYTENIIVQYTPIIQSFITECLYKRKLYLPFFGIYRYNSAITG